MSTELERAEASYTKARAIRDVRKRQYQQAQRDVAAAADVLMRIKTEGADQK